MIDTNSTACRSSMYRMIGCCVSESPGSVQRALAAPLDCISKKGFGSYNLALEAKALMTPTLMVSALCGSCSCNSVLQLLKTVQSNERLIQARLRLHNTVAILKKKYIRNSMSFYQHCYYLLRTRIRTPCLLITALYYIRRKDTVSYVGSSLVHCNRLLMHK